MGTSKRNSAGAAFAVGAILALVAPATWGQTTVSETAAANSNTPVTHPGVPASSAENPAPTTESSAPAAPAAPVSSPAITGDLSANLAQKIRQLDADIAKQNQRRSSAKAGFVIGGVVILGGIIATAVQTANEEEKRAEQTGQYSEEVSINWTGFGVGVLIAVPIIVSSVSTLRDANRQTRELSRQKRALSLTSGHDGLRLNIAFNF